LPAAGLIGLRSKRRLYLHDSREGSTIARCAIYDFSEGDEIALPCGVVVQKPTVARLGRSLIEDAARFVPELAALPAVTLRDHPSLAERRFGEPDKR
jgi:hypothetical protein